jgi:hypothetical protein
MRVWASTRVEVYFPRALPLLGFVASSLLSLSPLILERSLSLTGRSLLSFLFSAADACVSDRPSLPPLSVPPIKQYSTHHESW